MVCLSFLMPSYIFSGLKMYGNFCLKRFVGVVNQIDARMKRSLKCRGLNLGLYRNRINHQTLQILRFEFEFSGCQMVSVGCIRDIGTQPFCTSGVVSICGLRACVNTRQFNCWCHIFRVGEGSKQPNFRTTIQFIIKVHVILFLKIFSACLVCCSAISITNYF